jgi:hypothetical protein
MKRLIPWLSLLVVWGCSGSVETDDPHSDDDDTPYEDDDDDDVEVNDTIYDLEWRLHDLYGSVAYITWRFDHPGLNWIEYEFKDSGILSTPPREAPGGEQEQILVGLPYDTEVTFWIYSDAPGGRANSRGHVLTTGPLPEGLPLGTITHSEPDAWEPTGNYLLTSICEEVGSWDPGDYWTFIVDRQGRPVWASEAPDRHWTLFAQVSHDGTYVLWDESTYWLDWGTNMGVGSTIHKQYLDAEIEVVPADGITHAFVELPDGTLAWGSEYHIPHSESLVELAPGDTEPTVLWNCDADYPGTPQAYCSSNGLFYEASTDSYLYSHWDESLLVEVDGETGENLWWAGSAPGGYTFDPPESRFSFQHGVSYTDTGTVLLHSGGYGMDDVLMAREYEVDHTGQVLHEVWNYSTEDNVHGALNGDVWRLPGGNTLHTLGSAGIVREVTPDGDVIWCLDFQSERLMGRSEWIEDLYGLVTPAD